MEKYVANTEQIEENGNVRKVNRTICKYVNKNRNT